MSQAIALETLIRALRGVGARYLVGGSVASSSRGLPRATLDTDLVVQIGPLQTAPLAKALGADWYIDTDFARQSDELGRSFNVINIPTGHKFDLFPAHNAFNLSELDRAAIQTLSLPGGNVTCYVATAEDMILAKLHWYREGGEVSEHQWTDIGGMLAVNRDLDSDYLNRWAEQMAISDLLEKAIKMTEQI